jgi:hypothetical protein
MYEKIGPWPYTIYIYRRPRLCIKENDINWYSPARGVVPYLIMLSIYYYIFSLCCVTKENIYNRVLLIGWRDRDSITAHHRRRYCIPAPLRSRCRPLYPAPKTARLTLSAEIRIWMPITYRLITNRQRMIANGLNWNSLGNAENFKFEKKREIQIPKIIWKFEIWN